MGHGLAYINTAFYGGGYSYVILPIKQALCRPHLAASLRDPLSGRSMEVWTTAPGIQVILAPFSLKNHANPASPQNASPHPHIEQDEHDL